MSKRISIRGVARGPVLIALAIVASGTIGCHKSEDVGASANSAHQAVPAGQSGSADGKTGSPLPPWNPAPIELPKLLEYRATADADFRAAAGATWPGTGSGVKLVRFNRTGDLAVAALDDRTLQLLDPQSGESRQHWQIADGVAVLALAITLDDKRVVALQDDGKLSVYDLTDGKLLRAISHPVAKISAFALAADPQFVAIGTERGGVQLQNLESGQVIEDAPQAAESRVTALAFSNNCQKLFVACEALTSIGVLSLPDMAREATIEQPSGKPIQLAPTWGGTYLMVLCDDRVAELILIEPNPRMQLWGRYGSVVIDAGEPTNWAMLQNNSHLCSYLGQEAFAYYDLFEAVSAGKQGTAPEEILAVSVSPDGAQAATAFPDGTVRFYKLPGPGLTSYDRNGELMGRLRALLKAENWNELDEQAEQALRETKANATGGSPSSLMVNALERSPQTTTEAWNEYLAQLTRWTEAKPDSRAARLILAAARIKFGWQMRGTDLASKTSMKAFQQFHEQLSQADELLTAADKGGPSAPVCAEQLTVAMALSKGGEALRRIWKRGLEDDPSYLPLHSSLAYALLPRWGGQPGELAQMADQAFATLEGDDRHVAYARFAMTFVSAETPLHLVAAGFDLERLDESAQVLVKRCPEALPLRNLSTIVALVRGDRASTAKRMREIANRHDLSMWKNAQVFEKFRQWAQRKQIASDAEFSFPAAWHNLRHVAFEHDANKVTALTDDFSGKLHTWNLNDPRDQTTSELRELLPWFMDPGGRWIVGQSGQVPRVSLFDRETGDSSFRPDIDPQLWMTVSPDEKFLSGDARDGRVYVYELENDKALPQSIRLKQSPRTMALTNGPQAWNLVVAENDGGLRWLWKEGQELARPVKLPRVAHRLLPFPKTAQVLVVGQGYLVTVDLESGAVRKLWDSTPGADNSVRYSAIAISRDESLVAAARVGAMPEDAAQPYPVEIWNLADGKRQRVFAGAEIEIASLAFSPDGQRLAGGDKYGILQIWNLGSPGK